MEEWQHNGHSIAIGSNPMDNKKENIMKTDVLIVGAGPTGLMLACWLARLGIHPLVIDKKEGLTRESRAMGVQARTLETYDMLGIVERALPQGVKVTQGNM